MELRKSSKQKVKIRLGFSAVAGGGKTYSALLVARGMTTWDKIAVIDTENNSADLYADLGDYNVLPLSSPYSPENYIKAIKTCEDAGMEVIIIDSITHEWDGKGGILEIQSALGGRYQDWATVTPRHQKFLEAILNSKCHVFTTVRRKQDYSMEKQADGKTVVQKLGLKEVTRDGWEYELTINLEMDTRHNATSTKDRTGLFEGKPAFIPSIETGKMILAWCESGAEPIVPNYEKQLIECKNLVDLQAVWLSLSADDKLRWNDLKERVKLQLTPPPPVIEPLEISDMGLSLQQDNVQQNKVIGEYGEMLYNCKTLLTLKKAWDAIPAEIKPDYLALKDSVKKLLTMKK